MPATLQALTFGTGLALISLSLLRRRLPRRPNARGHTIPTASGTVFVPIILTTVVLVAAGWLPAGPVGLGYLAYALAAAAVGLADDVWGGAGDRGVKGHLLALLRGRVTTGALKVLVLGGGAVLLGVGMFGFGVWGVLAAVLLAGSTNLANLFDVRPGRALKFVGVPVVALLFLVPGAAALLVLPLVGGAVGLFYFDLRGRIMLGDTGAAVYGSVLGYLVLAAGPGPEWVVALAAVLGLTALAEVSSISRLIEKVGVLRRFDLLGRGSVE
ncbi:MAG: hypothetical protein H0V53_11025 [Rubrobacter sp.]|nr:hypothetical protein [Rubrobacter sp.]